MPLSGKARTMQERSLDYQEGFVDGEAAAKVRYDAMLKDLIEKRGWGQQVVLDLPEGFEIEKLDRGFNLIHPSGCKTYHETTVQACAFAKQIMASANPDGGD